MSFLGAFNTRLKQFLGELVLSFPELKDLQTLKFMTEMMQSANPRAVQRNFIAVAGPLHTHILERNEAFFTDLPRLRDELSHNAYLTQSLDEAGDLFGKLAVFKDVWRDIDPSNKNIIWVYLRQLLFLAAKANNDEQFADLATAIISAAQAPQ